MYFQLPNTKNIQFYLENTPQQERGPPDRHSRYPFKTAEKMQFSASKHEKHYKTAGKTPKKNTVNPRVKWEDRIGVGTPGFWAIPLLQAAHARNTPPPWWRTWSRWRRGRVAGRQGGRATGGLGWAGGAWRLVAGGMAVAGGWWLAAWRQGRAIRRPSGQRRAG